MRAFCQLTRKQAALYQQSVADLAAELGRAEGMKRRGIVLASLMRLKQICNHPSQWLGDGSWSEADSGKLARLREIAEVIAAKQEKVLVFTQFREMTTPLAAFLGSVFGRPGLVLHGETAVGKRQPLVCAVPGGRARAVLRHLAQGRRRRTQPHRRLARRAFRPLVESGRRESGDRPCVSHRPDEERAGAQVRLPRDRRGEDRSAH